ncbi:glycoside hydrolase family 3 C-terminal domain-containing protein [Phycicoccus sp. BSK3Z-2]|uniref:Glycoside hydrolase family 3 C-terminal domain-containing protein n=1 Tax=Phycicoccus avicenniae TaxID=2828860 RepID=A0A941HYC6_9MICO|nr:glycoside hydrolase family 3 C-terminal domain-containing protein [Phycicoccus avicenniae]MBR7741697.1 glycoside hydrolase family 3 C-terminal domain-containing protein [Phycicoccus avicenniae]
MDEHLPDWKNPALPPADRARALVAAMTLEQKISQLHGNMETVDIYALSNAIGTGADDESDEERMGQLMAQIRIDRHVVGIDELGVPRMRVTNGPVGVGMGDGTPSPPATALPMTIGVAASFDPAVAAAYGDVIGAEAAHLGQHVLEGPGVCLHRTPIAGRNFEYFSEDPYLSGVMGVEVTKAIQGHDVIAMAKHFVLNDQEHERFRANVVVDEHVLRELYLIPFEMCCKDAEVAAVMSAYNRIRGTYATENHATLTDILRSEWGWEGYVQSDFWSCRSAAPSLNAGMDLEMPDAKWLNEEAVTAALRDTSLEIETVDRALSRRFTQMFRFGQFERPYAPTAIPAERHGAVARRIGAEMAVLLKNDVDLLPLPASVGRVLLVGMAEYAGRACQGGGGSSKVDPLYTVDPLSGTRDVLAELGSDATVDLVVVERDRSNLAEATEAAATADVVVVMAGLVATEGVDLASPSLPFGQDEMVEALLAANPRTVVVLKDSTPVLLPWIDRAESVIEVWNQGAEDGHVVAELLWGVVNPSGKVPTTYAARAEDLMHHGDPVRYPGTDEGSGYPTMRYTEGLRVGYRWFQSEGIAPLFPFGHGLSYTTFALEDVAVATAAPDGTRPVEVSVTVRNTGTRDGAEVVQVYLGLPVDGQPPRRLVGFAKVRVAVGGSERVTVTVDPAASHHPFSVWDHAAGDFRVRPGRYAVHVGTSSEDDAAVVELDLRG